MMIKSHMAGHKQRGMMLLEALLGLLIFSIGILALVGLQASAISSVSDSKYRTDAAFVANALISTIWADSANASTYAYTGTGTLPAALTSWNTSVQAALPGSGVAGTTAPIVTVTAGTAYTTVAVTVRWLVPKSTAVRQYKTVTYLTTP